MVSRVPSDSLSPGVRHAKWPISSFSSSNFHPLHRTFLLYPGAVFTPEAASGFSDTNQVVVRFTS